MNDIDRKFTVKIEKESKRIGAKLNDFRHAIFSELIESSVSRSFNWDKVSLNNTSCFEFEVGKPIRIQSLDPQGNYDVYGANGKIGVHSDYLYDQKIVIIGRVGHYCGNVYTTSTKTWVTNNAIILKIKESDFSIDFVAEMLAWLNLNELSTGAAQKFLSLNKLKSLTVYKPPIDVQENISKFLLKVKETDSFVKHRHTIVQKIIESKNNQLNV